MPGFQDTAVIALIALLLFGPKKLPVLARQLGKLMADFRRASNEFRSQMEEELRVSEQADRQKEAAALEAANAKKIESATPQEPPDFATPAEGEVATDLPAEAVVQDTHYTETSEIADTHAAAPVAEPIEPAPTPIATSGDLNLMPPATGLPMARTNGAAQPAAPESASVDAPAHETELETETLHG